MSKSLKLLAMLGLVAAVAACAPAAPEPEEFIIVEPQPISIEPVYTGKYK